MHSLREGGHVRREKEDIHQVESRERRVVVHDGASDRALILGKPKKKR